MTHAEIYTALINDTIRILGGPEPGESWNAAAQRLHEQVRRPTGKPNIYGLVEELQKVADEAGDNSPVARHARNLMQNLQIAHGLKDTEATYIPDTIDMHLQDIQKDLEDLGTTVVSYHLLEILGSEQALAAEIRARTGIPVEIAVTPIPDNILFQEKLHFNGRKTNWIITRLLPIVTVTCRAQNQETSDK